MEERYNYEKALYDDIKDYIKDNINIKEYNDSEDLYDALDEVMWCEDCITGNGPYGYTDEDTCAKYVGDNLKLGFEALHEFCVKLRDIPDDSPSRYIDSTIRCYLFHSVLQQVVDDLWKENK